MRPNKSELAVEDLIKSLIANWDDWFAEAGQQGQIEQRPEAEELMMKQLLREEIKRRLKEVLK